MNHDLRFKFSVLIINFSGATPPYPIRLHNVAAYILATDREFSFKPEACDYTSILYSVSNDHQWNTAL